MLAYGQGPHKGGQLGLWRGPALYILRYILGKGSGPGFSSLPGPKI